MKITQIREKEDAEALSVLDFDLLMEKIRANSISLISVAILNFSEWEKDVQQPI